MGEDEYVICADEKSSAPGPVVAATPTSRRGQAALMRVEFEYQRKGTLAYLAAYDVHRARLIGRLEPTTGIEPFSRLVEQVMTAEPYACADGCSGSSTTAPRTAGRPRSSG